MDINTQARREYNLPDKVHGALVTEVQADSAAAQAGLKAGDVILEINRQKVENADDAVRLTDHAKDKLTLLRVWSNGGAHYLVVDESQDKDA